MDSLCAAACKTKAAVCERPIFVPELAAYAIATTCRSTMPTIDLTDEEHAAVTVAIRRAVEGDKFPSAPRLDPLRSTLAKLDKAAVLERQPSEDAAASPRQKAAIVRNIERGTAGDWGRKTRP
jgi:hypothetical protein